MITHLNIHTNSYMSLSYLSGFQNVLCENKILKTLLGVR